MKFNHPELEKVFLASKKDMQSIILNANQLSEDIKNLEQHLSENGVIKEFTYSLPSYQEAKIIWGLWGTKFRLIYGPQEVIGFRPLVECKLGIRTKVHPYLADFLKKLVENSK